MSNKSLSKSTKVSNKSLSKSSLSKSPKAPFLQRNLKKALNAKRRKQGYYEFQDEEDGEEDLDDEEEDSSPHEEDAEDFSDFIVEDDPEESEVYKQERENLMKSRNIALIMGLRERLNVLKKTSLPEILEIEAKKKLKGKELDDNERALKNQILTTIQQTEEKLKRLQAIGEL